MMKVTLKIEQVGRSNDYSETYQFIADGDKEIIAQRTESKQCYVGMRGSTDPLETTPEERAKMQEVIAAFLRL